MTQLTTHVLDISAGSPAAGLLVELHALQSAAPPQLLASATTGLEGRPPGPLLAGAAFRAGRYSLTFHVARYFRQRGVVLPDPAFIEEAVLRVGISDPAHHYHVPLLIAPWSYSVYRGS